MKKVNLLGAIAGDTIGSIYEFSPTKEYNFPLLNEDMEYTDDSIMTVAIADWLLHDEGLAPADLTRRMRHWGQKYPYPKGGYGSHFGTWLQREDVGPYDSWGNGSAMRVSPVGYAFDTLDDTLEYAEMSAAVSHNHPEGIKGAQATAAAIFLARTGATKAQIRSYIHDTFGYDLDYSCDDIRSSYHFYGSCQETVPQSVVAFLDSRDYEDAVRLAVSLGGDADTMGAITGAIAGAYYREMPESIYDFAFSKLPRDMRDVVEEFERRYL